MLYAFVVLLSLASARVTLSSPAPTLPPTTPWPTSASPSLSTPAPTLPPTTPWPTSATPSLASVTLSGPPTLAPTAFPTTPWWFTPAPTPAPTESVAEVCGCAEFRNGAWEGDATFCVGPAESWGSPCYPVPDAGCNSDWTFCDYWPWPASPSLASESQATPAPTPWPTSASVTLSSPAPTPWPTPVPTTPFSAEFLAAVGFTAGPSCVQTGRCYVGNNPAKDCCVGHAISTPYSAVACTEQLSCAACKKAASWIVGALTKEACLAIIPSGDVTCEVIGLGPEDPMADICAAVVTIGCPLISKLVARGVKDPLDICQKLDYCTAPGASNGRIFGTECGCVASGKCTAHAEGCCSGEVWEASFLNPNHCYYTGGLMECK